MLFDGVVFLRSFRVLDVLDIKQDPGHRSLNDLNRFITARQRSVEGNVFSRVCLSVILSMMCVFLYRTFVLTSPLPSVQGPSPLSTGPWHYSIPTCSLHPSHYPPGYSI